MSMDDTGSTTPRKSDFTIEHILNRAGVRENFVNNETVPTATFPWLQCTRYCPPKIPRKRETPQKRQLGRHPRIPFTGHQLAVLEEKFQQSPYLSSEEVTRISRNLQLADVRVKIWFQNRRARERRERALAEKAESSDRVTNAASSADNGLRDVLNAGRSDNSANVLIPVTSTIFVASESHSNPLFLRQMHFSFQNT